MIGGVFSENQYCITVFDFRERRRFEVAVQDLQLQAGNFGFDSGKAGIEIVLTNQRLQREVSFQ